MFSDLDFPASSRTSAVIGALKTLPGRVTPFTHLPYSFLYKLHKFAADSLSGIEIPRETTKGSRFVIKHIGDAVIVSDCAIRKGVTNSRATTS